MLAIDPKDVNPLELPSLPLESRHNLSDISALYFVIDKDDQLLYIGRTISLIKRWRGRGHSMFRYLEERSIGNIQIAWLKCDERLINSSETKFIAYFKPLVNYNYGNRDKKYQELIRTRIPYCLTPQKFDSYCGPYLEGVEPKNGKFNWQYGNKYRACLIQNLEELASEFKRIKCAFDSEIVSLWADEWLQFIQEGLEK